MATTLTPVRWMCAGAIGSAALAAALAPPAARLAVVLGMVGPLLAAAGSWILIARAWHEDPIRVTGVMLRAWGAKAVFFASYVVAVIKGLEIAPLPFAISLSAYVIVLYAAEAALIWQLFSRAWNGARS
jgi:hypothetical protein